MEITCRYIPENWCVPLDWRKVFPRPGPIEVDLGCGSGDFLCWAARTWPERNFLGVERLLERLRKADRKLVRQGLTNVRLIRVEVGYFVMYMVPPESVRAYHLYFPDPWPKRRHRMHRLVQPEWAEAVRRTLQPGGVLHVATDSADYFAQIQQVMSEAGFSALAAEDRPPAAQTEFEREFLASQQPIYRARFRRDG